MERRVWNVRATNRKWYSAQSIEHRAQTEIVNRKSQIVNRKSDPPLLLRYYTGGQVPRRTGNEPSSSGFTSIELIVVIIALSILAGTAVVSFRLSDQDKSTIAADQLIADIQYVQMRAMGVGSQQNISFSVPSSFYAIRDSGNNIVEQKNLPDGVMIQNTTLPGHTLVFNTLGEPTFGTSDAYIYLGKGGGIYRTLQVSAITGKVQ
jgi:type II secretory pathway pseudopilin PulG